MSKHIEGKLDIERSKLDVNGEYWDDAIFNYNCVLEDKDPNEMLLVLKYLKTVNQISKLEATLEPIFG